jgi:hypothetical protein
LAQQLVDAGERVVDVPATLSARVRLLGTGKSNKNDANDARAVAIAALRAPTLSVVRAEDHATVRTVPSGKLSIARWLRRWGDVALYHPTINPPDD